MNPVIRVDALSRQFRVHKKDPGLLGSVRALFSRKWVTTHAVRDMSFSIDEGEIVGIIGANGAGKTTLVKMLTGIIHPSSGTARVHGHIPWERSYEFRHQISLIMGQKAQLWWDLPAEDCFLLLKEIYQIPSAAYQERLHHLAEILQVQEKLRVQMRRLSLGERMKMELIAALLHQPSVVFLDEPTIGLDISAQKAVRAFLLEYSKAYRPVMLLTSHYMEDIEALCNRIIILREGTLVFDGPLQEVLRRYAMRKQMVIEYTGTRESLEQYCSHDEVHIDEQHGIYTLEVPRSEVSSLAASLLATGDVVDLKIEEQSIGSIIEEIMKGEPTSDRAA